MHVCSPGASVSMPSANTIEQADLNLSSLMTLYEESSIDFSSEAFKLLGESSHAREVQMILLHTYLSIAGQHSKQGGGNRKGCVYLSSSSAVVTLGVTCYYQECRLQRGVAFKCNPFNIASGYIHFSVDPCWHLAKGNCEWHVSSSYTSHLPSNGLTFLVRDRRLWLIKQQLTSFSATSHGNLFGFHPLH